MAEAAEEWTAVAAVLQDPIATTRDYVAACDQVCKLARKSAAPKGVREAVSRLIATASDKALIEGLGACKEAIGRAKLETGGPPAAPWVLAFVCDSDENGRKLAFAYDYIADPPDPTAEEVEQLAPAPAQQPAEQAEQAPAPDAMLAVAAGSAAPTPAHGLKLLPMPVVAAGAAAPRITLMSFADAPRQPDTTGKLGKTGKGKRAWAPGENVVGFIGRSRAGKCALQPQTQVVIVNACHRLDRLPVKRRALLRQLFPPRSASA